MLALARESFVTHCNTLQHTATHCNTLNTRQHTATHDNTLYHPASPRTTLHHTAAHCNTLAPAVASDGKHQPEAASAI